MPDLPEAVLKRLRPYQQEAFGRASTFVDDRQHSTGESFLVSMPTGSGKSGVIASLAQKYVETGDVLLLVPWDALATQLADDVTRKFWRHLDVTLDVAAVERLWPSQVSRQLVEFEGRTIWIATFAALQSMSDESRELLAQRLRVLIVDEGHYEPAPAWGRTIRSMGAPVVIFTATPYRNDYKYFQIAPDQTFRYRHVQAVEQGHIRRLEVSSLISSSADEFVASLLNFDQANLRPGDRTIVRCSTADEIRHVTQLLLTAGQAAIGVHERFKSSDNARRLYKEVPPMEADAKYWVHQNKLIEGIDDPRFRHVALFSPFANERSLVQQVGRVLRKDSESVAFLTGGAGTALADSWHAFLEYDESGDLARNPIRAVLETLSQVEYIDGAFRKPWQAGGIALDELVLPKSVGVFQSLDALSDDQIFRDVAESVRQQMAEQDYWPMQDLLLSEDRPNFGVHLYGLQNQSPLLSRTRFSNVNLGASAILVRDGLVYFQATGRVIMSERYVPIAGDRLRAVFDSKRHIFSAVTLANTDLGRNAERTRSVSARSIDLLAPDLGDYAKSPSALVGLATSVDRRAATQELSRYVGFNRARIREDGALPMRAYLEWLDRLHGTIIKSAPPIPTLFDRFAETVQPGSFEIMNVLLDFDFSAYELGGLPLDVEDSCVNVASGAFGLQVAGSPLPINCTLSWTQGHFDFRSPDLDAARSLLADGRLISDAISQDQAFRVLVRETATGRTLIYVNSTFVAPRVQLSARSRSTGLMLDRLVVGSPDMDVVTSEKGSTNTPGSVWDAGSLFALIDEIGASGNFCGEPVAAPTDGLVVVCDDDSHETADFYLVNPTTRRLILVHAKVASRQTKVGASSLHEVTAQALKHLGVMRAGAAGFDRSFYKKRWDPSKPWQLQLRTIHRIRSSHTPTQATDAVIEALRDPNYKREVWIALGKGLSKAKLLGALRSPNANPRATQALYLLQSAWATVASTGAHLRLFVGE